MRVDMEIDVTKARDNVANSKVVINDATVNILLTNIPEDFSVELQNVRMQLLDEKDKTQETLSSLNRTTTELYVTRKAFEYVYKLAADKDQLIHDVLVSIIGEDLTRKPISAIKALRQILPHTSLTDAHDTVKRVSQIGGKPDGAPQVDAIDPEHINPESGFYLCNDCGEYHLDQQDYLKQFKYQDNSTKEEELPQ